MNSPVFNHRAVFLCGTKKGLWIVDRAGFLIEIHGDTGSIGIESGLLSLGLIEELVVNHLHQSNMPGKLRSFEDLLDLLVGGSW